MGKHASFKCGDHVFVRKENYEFRGQIQHINLDSIYHRYYVKRLFAQADITA